MTFSVCLISAKALLTAATGLGRQLRLELKENATPQSISREAREAREALAWVLALGGLQVQRTRRLPLPLKVLLLPAYGVEATLYSSSFC